MSTPAVDREKLKNQAEICSKTSRFDEMRNKVKLLVQKTTLAKPLTEDERELLAIAFKNCVGARRTAWRNLCKVGAMERRNDNARRTTIASAYRETIENELVDICKELLGLIDKKLIAKNMDDERAVFTYKLKGDYARYIAEVNVDNNRTVADSHIAIAEAAYKEADARAEAGLSDTHPLRLGLALNYSVFLHEMKEDHVTAIQIAKLRYDEALDELNAVSVVDQSRYGECRNLLTLLHENLKVWTDAQ